MEKDKNTARHLGLLRVRVWRGELRESQESSTDNSDSSAPSSPCRTTGLDEIQNELSEKALKGKSLSHKATCVSLIHTISMKKLMFLSLSAAVPDEGVTHVDFDFVDPFEVPLAIFYFKYRSRGKSRPISTLRHVMVADS